MTPPRSTHFYKNLYAILLCAALLFACKKDKSKPDYPVGSNENINSWILDSLQRYYYWNEQLTGSPNLNQSPISFFGSVRNAATGSLTLPYPTMPLQHLPATKILVSIMPPSAIRTAIK